jgi:hypothetical protein
MSDWRLLNAAVDRALIHGTEQTRRMVLANLPARDGAAQAERIRRRSIALARRGHRGKRLERARDALLIALHAHAAPGGWTCGWSDGSYVPGERPRAGVGGLLLDGSGHLIARLSRRSDARSAFDAELAALAALLSTATRRDVRRLRIHTDCPALARLWHARRSDPRLDAARALAAELERFELRAIPRLHNHTANRLARRATQPRTSE